MIQRRSSGTGGFGRAPLLLGIVVAACSTLRPVADPGRLEVWNSLRDPLAVVVGGRLFQIPACQVSVFKDVELRDVRVATPAGVLVADFDEEGESTPIGRFRYLLIGNGGFGRGVIVSDLRTRPNGPRPDGRTCTDTLQELLQPDREPPRFP